jgi:hypothetical protein
VSSSCTCFLLLCLTQVDSDRQRTLLEKAMSVIERVPPPAPTGPNPTGTIPGEEPAWKNCWNWNLCDVSNGSLVLDIKDGRIGSELKSQGTFHFIFCLQRPVKLELTPAPRFQLCLPQKQPAPASGPGRKQSERHPPTYDYRLARSSQRHTQQEQAGWNKARHASSCPRHKTRHASWNQARDTCAWWDAAWHPCSPDVRHSCSSDVRHICAWDQARYASEWCGSQARWEARVAGWE